MSDFDPDAYLNQTDSTEPAFHPDAYLAGTDHPVVSYDIDPATGKEVPVGSAADKALYSPTSGMSALQLGAAGLAKSVYDPVRGVEQVLGVKGAQQAVDEAAQNDKPLLQTTPGMLGYLGGTVGSIAVPGAVLSDAARAASLPRLAGAIGAVANPTTFTGAATLGAAQGALAPLPTGQNRLGSAALGAASGIAGQGISRVASGATDAITSRLEQTASSAVKALQDAGVPLDAAQRSGSIMLQRAKAMLWDNPLTANAQADFHDMQQKAVNKAFLSTIGANANQATPEVMNAARSRLENTYDTLATKLTIPYDSVEEPLNHVLNQARLTLNDQQFGVVQRNVDDVLNKAVQNNGVINGEQFQNLKGTLDRLSGSGDQQVGEFARDIRSSLNDGLMQSAVASGNAEDAQLLKQTNQQWRNMRTIEGAIDKDSSKDISPARVANIMGQKANRAVSIYGRGDTSLADLANAANELLPNRVPNSGTISRLAAQSALPLIGAGLGAAKERDWKGAAEGAAAGYFVPKIIQKAINSQSVGGQAAARFIGGAASAPNLPMALGGALQRIPYSGLLGIESNQATIAEQNKQ